MFLRRDPSPRNWSYASTKPRPGSSGSSIRLRGEPEVGPGEVLRWLTLQARDHLEQPPCSAAGVQAPRERRPAHDQPASNPPRIAGPASGRARLRISDLANGSERAQRVTSSGFLEVIRRHAATRRVVSFAVSAWVKGDRQRPSCEATSNSGSYFRVSETVFWVRVETRIETETGCFISVQRNDFPERPRSGSSKRGPQMEERHRGSEVNHSYMAQSLLARLQPPAENAHRAGCRRGN